MIKNNRHRLCVAIMSTLFFLPMAAHAMGLLTVYQQAVKSDPTFAKAQATLEAQKMNLPIARSGYLPQLLALGNGARQYTFNVPNSLSTISDYNWSYGYSLTITQPLLDLATWHAIQGAAAVVKAAAASYIAAQQSLMQRTTQAYFDVLKAYENLYYTIANKKAIWQQYVASNKKFHAGLIAVMDVYDAKSRYDQITAQELTARNNLSNKLEALHAITGKYYSSLNGLGAHLILIKPIPTNMEVWTNTATKQNYNLIAQRFNVLSAMQKVSQQSAADMPTLDLSTGFSENHQEDNQRDSTRTDEASLGLNLSYKPLQGGLVYASTRQARYNYVAASAELGVVYRQVVNQTHNNYTGIMSSLLRVQADQLRITSANKALVATEAGLKVGARTMVDVLNDLTTLYQAQQQFADDQYTYLTNFVDLKVAAGTLTESDLAQINHWLTRKIPLQKLNTQWTTFNLHKMDVNLEEKTGNEKTNMIQKSKAIKIKNKKKKPVSELKKVKLILPEKKSTVEFIQTPMPGNTKDKVKDHVIHIPGLDRTYQKTLPISIMPQNRR